MNKKRSALDALMPGLIPGGNKGGFGKTSVTNNEVLPNVSVNITDSGERQYRNRPKKEKAIRKTYSFYPSTVNALEKYADENGTNCSQVINLALRQLIPKAYFEVDYE